MTGQGLTRQLLDFITRSAPWTRAYLAREYQAIIACVVDSQVLNGAEFMNIAGEIEKYAAQELHNSLIMAKQIDCGHTHEIIYDKTIKLFGPLLWTGACQLPTAPNRNDEEFMSGYKRIRISAWLPMMALAANQGGSNG
jgi:hypothetical protein